MATQPVAPTGRIMLRNVRLSFAQGLFAADCRDDQRWPDEGQREAARHHEIKPRLGL